jgi:antitoxin component YwqK of YwqJK toxin-antitoxin module
LREENSTMIYSIGKRIRNYIKVRIYQFRNSSIHNDFYDNPDNNGDDPANYEFKKFYYDSGNIKTEAYYENGKLQGIANYYYEYGNFKAREFYKDNQLNGLSKWYYESGEIKSERYYQNGTLVSCKEYNKAGVVIKQA